MLGGTLAVTIARRSVLWIAASVLLPVLSQSTYLAVSRRDLHFTAAGDYAAFALAIMLGLVCVALLPLRWYWRLAVGVVYVCVMGVVLTFYSLGFVCAAFGDCL